MIKKSTSSAVTRNPSDTWTSEAMQNGNIQAIHKRVLEDPGYLASRDNMGETPLQTAIDFGNLDLVEFLLQKGADPNVAVDDGFTCLLVAIDSDAAWSAAIVAALISAGADIHQAGTSGWTPLHMAAARGHAEKARILIAAGAKVNSRTEIDGQTTPLMAAASCGRPETVQLLLDNKADASLRDMMQNLTAVEMARSAAAGPDPKVYRGLREMNIKIDADQICRDMNLPPEQLAELKASMVKLDMAESYLQDAKQNAADGNHAEVIRILTEHAAKR